MKIEKWKFSKVLLYNRWRDKHKGYDWIIIGLVRYISSHCDYVGVHYEDKSYVLNLFGLAIGVEFKKRSKDLPF